MKVENGANVNKAFDSSPEYVDNSPSKKSLSKLPEYSGPSDEIQKDVSRHFGLTFYFYYRSIEVDDVCR